MSNNKCSPKDALLLGIENSAISVLSRAVEHDQAGRLPSALACYQEGVQLCLDIIKQSDDVKKKESLHKKSVEYITRAEKIKELIQKRKALESYHEQIQIANDSTGHSYESLFKQYLNDDTVTKVDVEDPYIRTIHQIYNFLSFCELLVKCCSKLRSITLLTGINENEKTAQSSRLDSIKQSLKEHGVDLTVHFSSTLHDREIRLSNGWIIKIGRGLDIFKPVQKFAIGFCDQNLRKCHETTVDIHFQNK